MNFQEDTVYNVGAIMADAMGKDWCEDRSEVVKYINKFREWLHLMYPELHLFDEKRYCLEVQKFKESCHDYKPCGVPYYYGVTLPNDIISISSAWSNSEPLRLYSKWWESREGKGNSQNSPNIGLVEIAGVYRTERDITEPSVLQLLANDIRDDGKEVILRGVSVLGVKDYKFKLQGEGIVEVKDLISRVVSIVLPANLVGKVTLLQDNGFELSEYSPYCNVPAFKRLKLHVDHHRCEPPKHIEILGLQKYSDIYFDSDIVEVGSRLIIEAAGRMFRYGEDGLDGDELTKSLNEEGKLKKLITGIITRERGNQKMDRGLFRGNITKIPFPGYTRYEKRNKRRPF